MVWVYIAVALGAATGAFLLGRLVRNNSAKRLIGAWVCLVTGACFFVVYALEDEHSRFTVAAGLTMLVIGVVALIGATVMRSTTIPARSTCWRPMRLEALFNLFSLLAFPTGNRIGVRLLACLALASTGLVVTSPLLGQEPKLRATLKGHTGRVTSVGYSPDGKMLATGSWDETIKLWGVQTGKLGDK